MSVQRLYLFLFVAGVNFFSYSVCFRIKRDSIIVNDLVDPILEKFRRNIQAQNKSVIPVEDFEKSSIFNVYGKRLTLMTFKGVNGSIRDLSTVYRIGDITLQHFDSPGVVLNFRFGLRYLQYSSDSYVLRFPIIGFSGKLVVDVDSNEIAFNVTVHHVEEKCYFKVNFIKVVKLDGIRVRLTGFSILNKVLTRVLLTFKDTIEKQIENKIIGAFIAIIEENGICSSHEVLHYR